MYPIINPVVRVWHRQRVRLPSLPGVCQCAERGCYYHTVGSSSPCTASTSHQGFHSQQLRGDLPCASMKENLSSLLHVLFPFCPSQRCQIFSKIIKEKWVKCQGCKRMAPSRKVAALIVYPVSLMKLTEKKREKCRCIHPGKLLNNYANMDEFLRL